MAEIIKVNIEISEQQEKLSLKIPEITKVPVGSIVQWNIIGFAKLYKVPPIFWRRGLIFTIYFSKKSPFSWRRQFIQLHQEGRFFPYYLSNLVRLAEDFADEKGDYKYGIKVNDGTTGDEVFDEDPYLIVF